MNVLTMLGRIFSPFKRRDEARPHPKLANAMAAVDAAEAAILADYPDGDFPPEAQDKLAKIEEMRKLTAAAMEADADDDLQTLVSVAKSVRSTREGERQTPLPLPGMTEEGQALFDAITWGDLDALQNVLTHADVNETYGEMAVTPLVRALATPDIEIDVIVALLEAGADVTLPTPWGGNGLSAMASADLTHWPDTAVAALAQAMLDLGAGFDATDDEGQPPLHAAILRENEKVTRAFVALGAPINLAMADDLEDEALRGGTPLHMAVWQPDLVACLMEGGAYAGALNTAGQTPADYAAFWLDEDCEPDEMAGLQASLDLLHKARAA